MQNMFQKLNKKKTDNQKLTLNLNSLQQSDQETTGAASNLKTTVRQRKQNFLDSHENIDSSPNANLRFFVSDKTKSEENKMDNFVNAFFKDQKNSVKSTKNKDPSMVKETNLSKKSNLVKLKNVDLSSIKKNSIYEKKFEANSIILCRKYYNFNEMFLGRMSKYFYRKSQL